MKLNSQNKQLSRKLKRKLQRKQKKQKIKNYYQRRSNHKQENTKKHHLINKKNNAKIKNNIKIQNPKQQLFIKQNKDRLKQKNSENIQDQEIKMLQQKLGIKKGKVAYSKIAKQMGLDDDLFDFLDGISKKVNKQQKQGENKNLQRKKILKKKKTNVTQKKEQIANEKIQQKQNIKLNNISQQENQARKGMNSLLNKLSDGNLALTFQQFITIFQKYPKSITVPIFSQLFSKFNLMIQKPIFHILMANICLASALHQIINNRLFGPLIHYLTSKFLQLECQPQNLQEIQQIGYSKVFERKKNYIMIICYFYDFGSITADFIITMVQYLRQKLNEETIEFLSLIIQKIGYKMRKNDPKALKTLLQILKDTIEKYKMQNPQEAKHSKVKFIELQMNQIRMNKKKQFYLDQRMSFLYTFINKNVKQVYNNSQDVINAQTSKFNWWQPGHNMEQQNNHYEQQNVQINQNRRVLDKIARDLRLVTEVRKNIFYILMESQDYIEATQKILDNKTKNMQDVATVIVKLCISQNKFNPYYALVAEKIASLNPKFRLNIQYAVWDHLKQLSQLQLRNISNLAKLLGHIISSPLSNCSLSILSFFHDLSNLNRQQNLFISIFFKYFFKSVTKQHLAKLISKLNEKNNYDIKVNINEYLTDYQCDDNQSTINLMLCKRLLMIQRNQNQQNE